MTIKTKNTNTETDILNAAKNVFQRKGMDGARMQEIADEAGINKALLHYYYRSKKLLFEAVFKNAFKLLAPQLNNVLNDDSDIFEKIKNFTDSYISFVLKHPYLPNFIINELNRNPEFAQKLTEDKHFPSFEKFKKQINDCITAKIIRPLTPDQLFINIISLNAFPFIAAPLLKGLADISDKEYNVLIEKRKNEVAEFIINAIKL